MREEEAGRDNRRTEEVRRRTRTWVDEAVVGLNLCPFASSVIEEGTLRMAVEAASGLDDAVGRTMEEADRLLEHAPDEVRTTLVIFERGLSEFDQFLEAAARVRGALEVTGADELLQIATFHPDYRFEGAAPEAAANYTNRAPYPTLHLLRERDVARAVESHPDPEGIPDANIARLEEMGIDEIRRRWSEWMPEKGTAD